MRPKVRFLEVQPYGEGYLLSDPLGLSPSFLASAELLFLLSLMDGRRDEEEIRKEFFKGTGKLLPKEELKKLVKELEELGLLLSERFFERLREEKEKLLSAGVREPSHAGSAYPEDPEELRAFLDALLSHGEESEEKPTGLLVPHIDLKVAGRLYGKLYKLVEGGDYDLAVVLGVSHYHHETPFSVLPLHLKTPLGLLETDGEKVEELKKLFDYDLYHDLLSYRLEHSVEFPAVFLKHLLPEVKVLPAIVAYGDPSSLREVALKLTRVIEKAKRPLVISSVDFSHVGRKFGDPAPYDPSPVDRAYLELLLQTKSEEAFKLLEKSGNKTRIDGLYTNFVFLEVLKNLGVREGREVGYEVYEERATASLVSYAGAVF